MTLYLKYRPNTLNELDLTSVRESLQKILKSENVPHALLFSGPRGAGKTSAARIVAKVLNCENLQNGEPCNKCEQCSAINSGNHMDVIELDAASNRGIDDIRALRESVGLSPQTAKKKIYIIDEAHMLTTEAANAFLKTLEEPPSHVQFIFATTDPQKLPETIKSRLYTIAFTKASKDEIARQLSRVIKGENLSVEEGVVGMIAASVDGSFRDAVKKLEGLALENEKITLAAAEKYLYQTGELDIADPLSLVVNNKIESILENVDKYAQGGGDMKLLVERLIDSLRKSLLARYGIGEGVKSELSTNDAIYLIELLFDARSGVTKAHIPQLPLEIALIKWKMSLNNKSPLKSEKKVSTAPVEKKEENKKKEDFSATSVSEMLDNKISAIKNHSDAPPVWPKILAKAKQTNTTVEALLRAAELLEFDGQELKLGVHYQFHKERLEAGKNREFLNDIVKEVCGPVKLSLTLTQTLENRINPNLHTDVLTEANDEDIIEAAKEIFGE